MNELRIIKGENVDLISPFPLSEVKRLFGWLHCYRTLTESDDTPQTMEEFCKFMEHTLPITLTWGVIDKNHLTNDKHEAPLVGFGSFEPLVMPNGAVRNGWLHVATSRRSWKARLVDEAGEMVLKELFDSFPTLLRLSSYMNERNAPAKAFVKRLGFKFEGIAEDALLYDGRAQNLVLYGLTRRNYLCHKQCLVESEMVLDQPLEGSLEVAPPLPQQ